MNTHTPALPSAAAAAGSAAAPAAAAVPKMQHVPTTSVPTLQLYVGNLPEHATADDLRALVASLDVPVLEASVRTKTSAGGKSLDVFGFLTFPRPDDTEQAFRHLNGLSFRGNKLNTVYSPGDATDTIFVGSSIDNWRQLDPQQALVVRGVPMLAFVQRCSHCTPSSFSCRSFGICWPRTEQSVTCACTARTRLCRWRPWKRPSELWLHCTPCSESW